MKIKFKKTKSISINETFILNKEMSLKAKGLLFLILASGSDDSLSIEAIAERSKESVGAIKSAIKELIELGYIEKKQKRENGRFASNSIVVTKEVISQDFEEKIQPTKNTPTASDSSVVSTININNNIINNNNTNSTENTERKSSVNTVTSLNAKKEKNDKAEINAIGQSLTPTQKRFLLTTINNLQNQGSNISNPKELFAEIEFSVLDPHHFAGKTFTHKVNSIAMLIRNKRWTTPRGFSNHSAKGKALKEAKAQRLSQYYQEKEELGAKINSKEQQKDCGKVFELPQGSNTKQEENTLRNKLSTETKYLEQLKQAFNQGAPWVKESLVASVEKKIKDLNEELNSLGAGSRQVKSPFIYKSEEPRQRTQSAAVH
jgi:predicted transcriptional regulator